MTNPERLWAYTHRDGDIRAETSLDLAEQDRAEYGCDPAPVAEYVLASVASQREAAIQAEWVAFRDEVDDKLAAQVEINAALHDYSDEITVRICQMAEDLGLKSEPLEVGPDAAEVLSAIHDVLGERDALRRERDAPAAALQVATAPHGVPFAAYERLSAQAERDAQRAGRMRCFLNRLAAGEVWNAKLDADYIRDCDDRLLGHEAAGKGVG